MINKIKSLSNSNSNEIEEKLFILLFEYIPSLYLFDFSFPRAQMIFSDNNYKSREIFISIGKILAIDILLNNSERIPLISNIQGNPENLLFRINPDNFFPNCNYKDPNFFDIFIDNPTAFNTKVLCLNPDDKVDLKKLAEYLNLLAEFTKEFFYEMKNLIVYGIRIELFDFKILKKVSEFFKNSIGGYVLSSLNLFHISIGLIVIFEDIAKIQIEDVENLIDFVQNKAICKDWADSYKKNAKLLSPDYFKYIVNYFKQVKMENEEIFNWVDDVTQGFYSSNFSENYKKEILKHESFKFAKTSLGDEKKYLNNSLAEINEARKISPNKEKVSISQKISKSNEIFNLNSSNKNLSSKLKKEQSNYIFEDDFNFNKKDKKKFINDVHNGIYDVLKLEDKMILEVVKREFVSAKKQKEIEIKDYKQESSKKFENINLNDSNEKKNEIGSQVLKDNSFEGNPYKKYTIEELKDKIKRDELKETLNIKKSFNPEEGKFLEEKIKEVDEDFFKESETNNNNFNKSKNFNPNESISISVSTEKKPRKSFANLFPKKRDKK